MRAMARMLAPTGRLTSGAHQRGPLDARQVLGCSPNTAPYDAARVVALLASSPLQLSSSTDCTAGCRVSAPSSWPGGPFDEPDEPEG